MRKSLPKVVYIMLSSRRISISQLRCLIFRSICMSSLVHPREYGNTTEVLCEPPVSMAKLWMLDVYSSTINCLKLCCCRYATVLQPLPAFYMGWILNIFLTFPLSGTMERIAHTPGELFEVACKWHVARKTVCCTSVAQCISIHNSCMRQHVLPSCRCPGCGGVLGQAMNPSPSTM